MTLRFIWCTILLKYKLQKIKTCIFIHLWTPIICFKSIKLLRGYLLHTMASQEAFSVTSDFSVTETTNEPDYTSITAQKTLKIIYYCIGSLGLAGNLLVITVILNYKSMRKTITNRFIFNQSCCDGVVAVILILSSVFEDDGRRLSGTADTMYCKLWLTKMLLWGLRDT